MKLAPYFLGILIFLVSCKTTKITTKNTGTFTGKTVAGFLDRYQESIPELKPVKIKSKLEVDLNGNHQNLGLRLYIEDEQLIWANASLLGISGARANITPEGVKAYEILDKTFVDGDFSFFNNKLSVDFITYDRLQKLLLGQLFLIDEPSQYELEIKDGEYWLNYADNEKIKTQKEEGKYVHSFQIDEYFRLNHIYIYDPSSDTTIEADYSGWGWIENYPFPGNVKILVKNKKTQKVELEYNKFEFGKYEAPFRIPNGYKERKF